MRRLIPPDSLARDERFNRITTAERFNDPRRGFGEDRKLFVESDDVPDRARRQMHGIFVGEIQALEGAGRTAYDYDLDEIPFALKLDMARQCWDEARHVEISIKLGDHMGTDIGEYSEAVTLFEASCHPDPVFRLAGVNRALEGLAIDVFTTMRDFADEMGDPVLRFCEDWMLADEVTHVKMGSRWLREVTEGDAGSARGGARVPAHGRFAVQLRRAPGRRSRCRRSSSPVGSVRWPGSAPTRSTRSRRWPPSSAPHSPTEVSDLGPLGPHLLHVLHRVAELADPVGLMATDEPHAPRQGFAATARDACVDQGVEHRALGHPQPRHHRDARVREHRLDVATARGPRDLLAELRFGLGRDPHPVLTGVLTEALHSGQACGTACLWGLRVARRGLRHPAREQDLLSISIDVDRIGEPLDGDATSEPTNDLVCWAHITRLQTYDSVGNPLTRSAGGR